MAPGARGNPNCANASNPYHECTQACLQPKTKHSSRPRPPNKNKTSSGYGELGKKVNGERRKYAGCPKASNPYHNCDENCNKILSTSGGGPPPPPPPLKYESKRQKAAASNKAVEPPRVVDNVPSASKAGAIYLSDDASSSSSPASDAGSHKKEVVEPAAYTSELIPLQPLSGEIQPHVKPASLKAKDQLNEEDKEIAAASQEVIPITYVDEEAGEDPTTSAGGGGSADSAFSGFPHHQSFNEGDSDHGGETESVMSESSSSRIAVGGYNVKETFAPILQSILHKYGDIGATCQLESLAMRSYYIECVCFVVQELQSASILQITNSKVKELSAIVKDVESAQLRVAWLRSVLGEIAENIKVIHQNQGVQEAMADSEREVQSLRVELESQLQTLAQKEQEVADIKTRIPEIRDRLSQLELKSSAVDKTIVDNLHIKSLIGELLLL